MKCKICGKNYRCNKCAYDKHVDSHKMEPFKIGICKFDNDIKNSCLSSPIVKGVSRLKVILL